MKIALAQLNPTVGDIAGNARKISRAMEQARREGASLVVFAELSLLGYPPRDLLLKGEVVRECQKAAESLAHETTADFAAIVGSVAANPGSGRPLYNAALFLYHGKISRTVAKALLPTYDVFDEDRYFEPGREFLPIEFSGRRLGVTICEDIWNDKNYWQRARYGNDPPKELASAGADCLVNLSASPFWKGKRKLREEVLQGVALRAGLPLAYVNQVGGDDELVFDGNSCAIDRSGNLLAHAKDFEEDLLVVDLDHPHEAAVGGPASPSNGSFPEEIEEVYRALVLGTRDYVQKCAFPRVLIGLSGGIDSSLTAAIAADALGPRRVLGVSMPGRYSSEHSKTDAALLAGRLGIELVTIPIEKPFSAFLETLRPAFDGRPEDVTEENLQARIRGTLLMALSNKLRGLVLSTGNKSELATGYCTLYGDMAGGLDVLADVPKTLLYELARFRNRKQEVIPEGCFTKPPSAELRPNQTDQDSLPPYDLLDQILALYVEQDRSPEEIVEQGLPARTVEEVIERVDHNEYKRRQAAIGIKVTSRAFGSGRRLPIAQRFRRKP